MKVIRLSVFETNSSSTHSMSILSEEEFSKWQNGELLKLKWEDEFVSKEDNDKIIQALKEKYAKEYKVDVEDIEIEDLEEIDEMGEKIPMNFEDYDDWMDLERDINYYTTKSGEKLVIVCWFGNDY